MQTRPFPILLAAAALAGPLGAQASGPASPSLEVGAQFAYVAAYGGTASVKAAAAHALSLRAGYRIPLWSRRTVVEGYAARAGRDRDPYHGTPGFAFAGVGLRYDMRRGAGLRTPSVEPYWALGVARMRVDAGEQPPCDPPLCMREGGGNFKDATFTAPMLGVGVLLAPVPRFAVRLDVRAHKPVGPGVERAADSGLLRAELASGVTVRW